MTDNTVLRIEAFGLPPYSARGLQQSYAPIAQASQPRRTINGTLRDLSAPQMRKYMTTISGADQQPPALDLRWPGLQVTVDWISEFAQRNEGTETDGTDGPDLGRTPVPGSVRYEGEFLFYRPRMTMQIVSFSQDDDEWGAGVRWQLVLEEV